MCASGNPSHRTFKRFILRKPRQGCPPEGTSRTQLRSKQTKNAFDEDSSPALLSFYFLKRRQAPVGKRAGFGTRLTERGSAVVRTTLTLGESRKSRIGLNQSGIARCKCAIVCVCAIVAAARPVTHRHTRIADAKRYTDFVSLEKIILVPFTGCRTCSRHKKVLVLQNQNYDKYVMCEFDGLSG